MYSYRARLAGIMKHWCRVDLRPRFIPALNALWCSTMMTPATIAAFSSGRPLSRAAVGYPGNLLPGKFYYPILPGYPKCKFRWLRKIVGWELWQWKVYRFGDHNNYSNVLSLNINTPATCRVLLMGTPVLEVCRRWEFPWVPWVPWESHGNGNKGAMWMGMGMGIS